MQLSTFRRRLPFLITSSLAVSLALSSCGAKEKESIPPQSTEQQAGQTDNAASSNESTAEEPVTDLPTDSVKEEIETPINHLIASLPERNIEMYGLDNGVELRVGDLVQQYDWIYNTPRGIEPRLAVKDYDGDGHNELAIILYVGSGTGISLEQLHMIEMEEDPKLQDHPFTENDYLSQVNPAISFKPIKEAEDLTAEVTVGSKKTKVIMKNYYDHDDFGAVRDQLGIRDVVGFSFDDNNDIKARFGVGLLFEKVVSPQYIGALSAAVSYHDGQFTLSNFEFDPEENL